jgi:WD40 repeat protein
VFSPDGKKLVTTHQGKSGSAVTIWDTKGWVAQVESGFRSAAFSKDGKLLALGGSQIKLIDASTGKQIRTIALPQMTMGEAVSSSQSQPNANLKIPILLDALAFSPDGRTLAAGSVDTTVRLVPITP